MTDGDDQARSMILEAEVLEYSDGALAAGPALPLPDDPPPPAAGGGDDDGVEVYQLMPGELPPRCPVTPLGVTGNVMWFLDASRQLRDVEHNKLSRLAILGLFGAPGVVYLRRWWPRVKKSVDENTGEDVFYVVGWKPEEPEAALIAGCHAQGVWDVHGRVRTSGAWLGEDGGLVLHCGNQVLFGPPAGVALSDGNLRIERPGSFGQHVYPAAEPKPLPAAEAPGAEAGRRLKQLVNTWNWKHGELDAHLLVGWIAAAMIGGALKWRPAAWVTGETGTGKSTLQDVIERVFGGALVSVSNATAAGIWQKLGHASLPVALDEQEADSDNRALQRVIQLARQASSGGVVLRGGASHEGAEFTARSCFLFSSILVPPLTPQDRSRIAVLELEKIAAGELPGGIDKASLAALGRQLRRRLLDGWQRLPQTIDAYQRALQAAWHSRRKGDQFGVLLACADLVLSGQVPSEDIAIGWADQLRAAGADGGDDFEPGDWQGCVGYLLTCTLDHFKGGQKWAVGTIVHQGAYGIDTDLFHFEDANQTLGTFGMRLIREDNDRGPPEWWLAVANTHAGLARLFDGTHWQAAPGHSSVWVQSLARVPGARRSNRRFSGVAARCVELPLAVVLPRDGAGPGEIVGASFAMEDVT